MRTAWRLFNVGQGDAALAQLEASPETLGLSGLLDDVLQANPAQRQRLYALLAREEADPESLHRVVLFAARHGDWAEADRSFAHLAMSEPQADAALLRLRSLIALAALPQDGPQGGPQGGIAAAPDYPYEDWAL